MALIVQKYGGTSAESPDGIRNVVCEVAKFRTLAFGLEAAAA